MPKTSTKGTQPKKRKTTQKKSQFNEARIDLKGYVRRLEPTKPVSFGGNV